jgi:hypothetical protein
MDCDPWYSEWAALKYIRWELMGPRAMMPAVRESLR